MKTIFYLSGLVNLILLSSCLKDKNTSPQPVVENEVVTTVQISVKDSTTNVTNSYKWENLSGFGLGNSATVDTIKLKPNTKYYASILLLDKTNINAIDTISNEVYKLRNEHQFFFTTNTSITIKYASTDVDDHGVPFGLKPELKTGNAENGTFEVLLKHQPNVKPKTGQGDKNLGSTDVQVSFPLKIQN